MIKSAFTFQVRIMVLSLSFSIRPPQSGKYDRAAARGETKRRAACLALAAINARADETDLSFPLSSCAALWYDNKNRVIMRAG